MLSICIIKNGTDCKDQRKTQAQMLCVNGRQIGICRIFCSYFKQVEQVYKPMYCVVISGFGESNKKLRSDTSSVTDRTTPTEKFRYAFGKY